MVFIQRLAFALVLLVWAGPAFAQDGPVLDWRRKAVDPTLRAAIGLAPEIAGLQFGAIVLQAPADKQLADGTAYRSMVMDMVVQCGANRWRITGGGFYDAEHQQVAPMQEASWAPLDRSNPMLALVADVCSGGHTESPGLGQATPVAALAWLAATP